MHTQRMKTGMFSVSLRSYGSFSIICSCVSFLLQHERHTSLYVLVSFKCVKHKGLRVTHCHIYSTAVCLMKDGTCLVNQKILKSEATPFHKKSSIYFQLEISLAKQCRVQILRFSFAFTQLNPICPLILFNTEIRAQLPPAQSTLGAQQTWGATSPLSTPREADLGCRDIQHRLGINFS